MATRKDVYRLTAGSLLLALSLAIPLTLAGTVSLTLGPFTATPASHVPLMLSMLFGPGIAAAVGLGSTIGFLPRLGPIVAMRAAMHMPVGIAGAWLVRRKVPFPLALAITAPVHALLEALIVLPFGYTLKSAGSVVALGTLVHHAVDSVIAVFFWGILFTKKGILRNVHVE
jgi:niacin transporter